MNLLITRSPRCPAIFYQFLLLIAYSLWLFVPTERKLTVQKIKNIILKTVLISHSRFTVTFHSKLY